MAQTVREERMNKYKVLLIGFVLGIVSTSAIQCSGASPTEAAAAPTEMGASPRDITAAGKYQISTCTGTIDDDEFRRSCLFDTLRTVRHLSHIIFEDIIMALTLNKLRRAYFPEKHT